MKPFIVALMAAAAVSGEVVTSNANGLNPGPVSNNNGNGNTGYNTNTGGFVSTPFAEARHAGDTYGAPSAPIVDSYSSPPSNVWPEAANAYPYSFAPSKCNFQANFEMKTTLLLFQTSLLTPGNLEFFKHTLHCKVCGDCGLQINHPSRSIKNVCLRQKKYPRLKLI